MLTALIEAAVRSLILALAVWLGLRIFRIHNVVSQRSAWTAVLLGSLLMPFALPFTSHWHVLSFATIPAPASLHRLQSVLAPGASTPLFATAPSSDLAITIARDHFNPRVAAIKEPGLFSASVSADRAPELNSVLTSNSDRRLTTTHPHISIARLAVQTYFVVAAALLLRLLFGFLSAMRLWHTSTPIPPVSDVPFGADLNLRGAAKFLLR